MSPMLMWGMASLAIGIMNSMKADGYTEDMLDNMNSGKGPLQDNWNKANEFNNWNKANTRPVAENFLWKGFSTRGTPTYMNQMGKLDDASQAAHRKLEANPMQGGLKMALGQSIDLDAAARRSTLFAEDQERKDNYLTKGLSMANQMHAGMEAMNSAGKNLSNYYQSMAQVMGGLAQQHNGAAGGAFGAAGAAFGMS